MKTKSLLTQAVTRGPFIDQSQSMNIFMAKPDYNRLTSSHFYAWKEGLKTGIYYLRSKPSTNAIKFSLSTNLLDKINNSYKHEEEDNECINCSA